jgi:hypothetical protein
MFNTNIVVKHDNYFFPETAYQLIGFYELENM